MSNKSVSFELISVNVEIVLSKTCDKKSSEVNVPKSILWLWFIPKGNSNLFSSNLWVPRCSLKLLKWGLFAVAKSVSINDFTLSDIFLAKVSSSPSKVASFI